MGAWALYSDAMRRVTLTVAAQERTTEHASVADGVGVVAVLAAAAVAVTAPVATAGLVCRGRATPGIGQTVRQQ
jgi:hypothetical protein